MSEELESKYLKNGKIIGQLIGEFEYFQIGATTFKQLSKAGLIQKNYNSAFTSHKPDRLIVNRNSSKSDIIAVIEDKKSGKFNSEVEKLKAIQQCNNYCQELKADIGIITDGKNTIWINPKQKNNDHEYQDDVLNQKRSYSIIKKEDGSEISRKFEIIGKEDVLEIEKMSDETRKIYKLIKEISEKINSKNSIIKEPETIDPLPLARKVWQAIWVATGKSPEKCLYNVVELFIFKFLSDLEILDENFEELYRRIIRKDSSISVLNFYVNNCRAEIKNKFEKGPDNTTIINGTIFVDESGNANTSQANLFVESIIRFKEFEKDYGKFSTNNIDKDFKTKIYESFLKQNAGVKALGQFFTPRKVIRNIVEMTGISDFKGGERVCDPFCGVGGFVLEPLNLEERSNDFRPKNGIINPKITYKGYDKGFEKDEERTIILAKANMLIHLAELLAESKNTKEFTQVFNDTFTLIRTNLGTYGKIEDSFDEKTKFDLIITNPPYLMGGSKTIKNEIEQDSSLKNFYSVNAGGLEGLAMEWIIRHLKKGGKAFIVVPDGILNRNEDKKLRGFILKECYLDAIISLPLKTFFTTSKKTYILAITKKDDVEKRQNFPVFTYLASEIGESRDVYRFNIEQDDLQTAVELFNAFKNSKDYFVKNNADPRCKLQTIDKFKSENHWIINKWWSDEEKIKLGVLEEKEIIKFEELPTLIEEVSNNILSFKLEIENLIQKKKIEVEFKDFLLSDLFDFPSIKGVTKSFIEKNKGYIPVYGGRQFEEPIGFIEDNLTATKYFENCLAWNRNGSTGYVFWHKHKFAVSDDHRPLVLKNKFESVCSLDYLAYLIEFSLFEAEFSWGKKAGKEVVKEITIKLPANEKGEINLEYQKDFVKKISTFQELKQKIGEYKKQIQEMQVEITNDYEVKDVKINDIFHFQRGRVISNEFINKKHGEYPVYSSNTKANGLFGYINSFDFDCEGITWTTDGIYAGSTFYRMGKFSITNVCGLMTLKEEYKDKVYLQYVSKILDFTKIATGTDNKKVMTNVILSSNIQIPIPVTSSGEFDLETQQEIANKYQKIEQIKQSILLELNKIAKTEIEL
jgi:type I restriction enzyme M protein